MGGEAGAGRRVVNGVPDGFTPEFETADRNRQTARPEMSEVVPGFADNAS